MVPFPLNDGLLIATHRSKLPNPLKTVKYIWAEDDSISAVTLINLVLLPRSIMYKAAIGAKDNSTYAAADTLNGGWNRILA